MSHKFWAGLEPVRAWLRQNGEEGVTCPCCTQFVKFYKRKLNSGMAISLMWLVTYHARHCTPEEPFVHMPKKAPRRVTNNRELPRLVHWGLVETEINKDTKKRCSGSWRPTKKGIDFVYRRIGVPSWIEIFNNHVRQEAHDLVFIDGALGTEFNYEELMRGFSE